MGNPQAYTKTAMLLHWVTASLLITLFLLGWYMVDLPKGPLRGQNFALHKSLGASVLILSLWRLGWRLGHSPPLLPLSVTAWQAALARAVHALFYLLLLTQPLTGYLSSEFNGHGTSFFGLPLPLWGTLNLPLSEFFVRLHVIGSLALLGLLATHLAGVLSHAFHPRDRFLRRMLPWN